VSSAWFQLPVHNAALPSLHGVRKAVPPLRHNYGALRLLAVHLAALRFLRLAIPSFVPCSSSPARDRAADHPGVGKPELQPAVTMETTRSPKFPGNPRDHSPCSSDPGVTRHASGSRCSRCLARPPRLTKTRAHDKEISRLNHTAFDLAVYASQGRSPATTQDSLPAAGPALPDGIGYQ
jgi:hypothetical protein